MTRTEGEATPARLPLNASLPRDLLDEVERELRETRRSLHRDSLRLASLEQLRAISLSTRDALRRPITVFDLVRLASHEAERARRVHLIRTMRSTGR